MRKNMLCVPVRSLPCMYAVINSWIPNSVNKIICGVPMSLCFRLFLTSARADIAADPGTHIERHDLLFPVYRVTAVSHTAVLIFIFNIAEGSFH